MKLKSDNSMDLSESEIDKTDNNPDNIIELETTEPSEPCPYCDGTGSRIKRSWKGKSNYWKKAGYYLLYGGPSHDKNGNSCDIRFKLRPVQMDIVSTIREVMPISWYKYMNELCRNLFILGCHTALAIIRDKKRYKKLAQNPIFEMQEYLIKTQKKNRINQLLNEMEDASNASMSEATGAKIINILSRIREGL